MYACMHVSVIHFVLKRALAISLGAEGMKKLRRRLIWTLRYKRLDRSTEDGWYPIASLVKYLHKSRLEILTCVVASIRSPDGREYFEREHWDGELWIKCIPPRNQDGMDDVWLDDGHEADRGGGGPDEHDNDDSSNFVKFADHDPHFLQIMKKMFLEAETLEELEHVEEVWRSGVVPTVWLEYACAAAAAAKEPQYSPTSPGDVKEEADDDDDSWGAWGPRAAAAAAEPAKVEEQLQAGLVQQQKQQLQQQK